MPDTLDYKGPAQPAEVPLTRCPKCGGQKRGACLNCREDRREKVGGKVVSYLIAAAVVLGFGLLSMVNAVFGIIGVGVLVCFVLYSIIVAAVRAAK